MFVMWMSNLIYVYKKLINSAEFAWILIPTLKFDWHSLLGNAKLQNNDEFTQFDWIR